MLLILRASALKSSFAGPQVRENALNMPTDIARVLEIAQEISKVVQDLTKDGSPLSNASHEELVRNAQER